MSVYPACPARKPLTVWGADGLKSKVQRCTEQEAEKANKDVLPVDCSDCPLRASLVEEVISHQPGRPKPRGTQQGPLRPDLGGEGYAECGHRLILITKSACSSCSKNLKFRLCSCDRSQNYKLQVQPADCASCPFRTVDPS